MRTDNILLIIFIRFLLFLHFFSVICWKLTLWLQTIDWGQSKIQLGGERSYSTSRDSIRPSRSRENSRKQVESKFFLFFNDFCFWTFDDLDLTYDFLLLLYSFISYRSYQRGLKKKIIFYGGRGGTITTKSRTSYSESPLSSLSNSRNCARKCWICSAVNTTISAEWRLKPAATWLCSSQYQTSFWCRS